MNYLWIAAVLGISASVHCVMMCGPLALALPVGRAPAAMRPWLRLFFVWGRWSVYATMGVLVGGLGQPISWLGFQEIWLGLGIAAALVLVAFWEHDFFRSFRTYLQKASAKLVEKQPVSGFYLLGMANGLIPCGVVYSALALSAVSGSAAMGGWVMLAFGLTNSWWHGVLMLGLRIPMLNQPGFAFLGSQRVAMAMVALALAFHLAHNTEGHKPTKQTGKEPPTETMLCR